MPALLQKGQRFTSDRDGLPRVVAACRGALDGPFLAQVGCVCLQVRINSQYYQRFQLKELHERGIMGKSHPDASKAHRPRPRQMSIIYFIDSARMRTLTISVGRLRLVIAGLAGLFLWSVGSVFLTIHLVSGEAQLEGRLRLALNSIFEYEIRDEHVFDLAYPQPGKVQTVAALDQAPAPAASVAAGKPLPAAELKGVPPIAHKQSEPFGAQALANAAPALKPADAVKKSSQDHPAIPVEVRLGKARFVPTPEGLELRLELTNKSGSRRVEGYIYAVAEFVAESGEHLYISSPKDLMFDAAGAVVNPHKAALFGIRRFTDKRFSFATPTGKKGGFASVHVELFGRNDTSRSGYVLPVPSEPNPPLDQSRAAKTGAPKPG